MSELYNAIEELCKQKGITITTMCKESGASRGSLSDLKAGRKQSLSADTLSKIAAYFSVSVDYLLGKHQTSVPEKVQSNDILNDVDIAFYGEYKELSEDDKAVLRDMVQVMRARRAKKQED